MALSNYYHRAESASGQRGPLYRLHLWEDEKDIYLSQPKELAHGPGVLKHSTRRRVPSMKVKAKTCPNRSGVSGFTYL